MKYQKVSKYDDHHYRYENNKMKNKNRVLPSQHFNVGSTLFQRCGSTLKMKQNPTSDFQRCTTLIQRQCPTLKQRRNNVGTTLIQRCFNLASTLVKAILNPIGLVKIADCEIVEYMLNTCIVFILLYEKTVFYYILTIQLLMKYQKIS